LRDDLPVPTPSPKYALDPVLVALGHAISSTRKSQGVSQEELAHRGEIDRSYMSALERGIQNPGVMVIVKIAKGMGVPVSELFARAGL
jgi:transcriptional regulator with XRE-family HTH domain